MAAAVKRMIVIFTDYGLHGPYLGQIKSVLAQGASDQRIITLLADAPRFNPKACAYLLASFARDFPMGTVFFVVVDPGVGSDVDKPVIIHADGCWYVGPDNGLFDIIARNASNLKAWKISWRPQHLSNTFHGRDLYAPVCGKLADGQPPPGEEFNWTDRHHWEEDLNEIIYIDHFGNAMTGIGGGKLDTSLALGVAGHKLKNAGKFSDVEPGEAFWYENSYGLVEIAVNMGSAAQKLGISVGDEVMQQ